MVSLREGLMLGEGGVVSLVGAGGKTSLMFRLAHELAAAGETVLTTTTTKIYEPAAQPAAAPIISDSIGRLLDKSRQALTARCHITAAAQRLPDSGKLSGFRPEFIQDIWRSQLFRWIIVEADGAAGRPLKAPAEHEPVIPACTSLLVGMVGLHGVGRPLNAKWVFRPDRFRQLSGLAVGARVSAAAIVKVLVHEMGTFKSTPAEAIRIAFCNQADAARNLAAGRQIARMLVQNNKTGLNRVLVGQILFDPPVREIYDLQSKTRQ